MVHEIGTKITLEVVDVQQSTEERAHSAAWQIKEEIGLSEHSIERVTAIIEEKLNEQKAIDDARFNELMEYLEELEAHYRKLRQYDNGKPIRRVISYIKAMEK